MAKVIAGITMSLDGYITGPDDRVGAGLGDGGERLHYWVFGGRWTYEEPGSSAVGVDKDYIDEVFSSGGAWIVGRTMHDVVDGWGDDPGFGVPVFVVTHRSRETIVKGNTTFEFVTAGITEASTTRNASTPRTLSSGSTTAVGSFALPILQVPSGWWTVIAVARIWASISASDRQSGPGATSPAANGARADCRPPGS